MKHELKCTFYNIQLIFVVCNVTSKNLCYRHFKIVYKNKTRHISDTDRHKNASYEQRFKTANHHLPVAVG
jgi:hypothetical protein